MNTQQKLHKNQRIALTITALSNQGHGLGRHHGQVVFVPTTAVGDEIVATITSVHRNHAYGEIDEIVVSSPQRIENDCPSYPACGGCSLRHIHYPEECRQKEGFLRENLRRIGGLEPTLDTFFPSPRLGRYRNKVQLPIGTSEGKVVFGFYAPRSHQLIPMEDCLLQPESFSALARELCAFLEEHKISTYDEKTHTGLVRHLYLRKADYTGELMAVVVINGTHLPHWEELLERWQRITPVTTLLINHNTKKTNVITSFDYTILHGPGVIRDRLLDVWLALSPDSFYQINYGATQLLYQQALSYANPQPEDVLVDLYCGVGAIGLTMAHRVKQLIGVEIVPSAVENARRNAAINQLENTRFLCADATKAAQQLLSEGTSPQIVVVDPPRKGVDSGALDAIASMAPNKLVYISCNSATLARDCAYLAEKGYTITRGRGVDLFPRTPHAEAVVLLEKE